MREPATRSFSFTATPTLILHDWGSGVGFNWATHNRGAVKAIAFMEAIVPPFPTWQDFNKELHGPIGTLRSPEGDQLVLEENFFIEKLLPGTVMRPLTQKEHAEYRRPFLNSGEDRRAALAGPRQLPIAGEPADTVALIASYAEYLANASGQLKSAGHGKTAMVPDFVP
jgi:haloalkane dehalogenase